MYRYSRTLTRLLIHNRPSYHSPLPCRSKTTSKRQKKIVVVKRELPTRQRDGSTRQKTLFRPVDVVPEENGANVGEELVGKLSKGDITRILKRFMLRPSTRVLASQQGLNGELFENALQSFRRYCLHVDSLPVELHIVISDIIADAGHVDDLFPFFLTHSKEVYPHLECMEDLKKISDLTEPPNWYPLARSLERKIIFHCGPTNSGKTYHALNRFLDSDSGVYCGPLRLLAMEVYDKINDQGTPCDLVTGETRRFANGESPSNHVSCTVEMMNVNQEYDVAVIDEIQMIADPQRGSAWTRALLGVAAREVHVCGEETAVELVQSLMAITGDTVEIRKYERLTKLEYEKKEIGGFSNIRPGDCVVCFKKNDIFSVCRKLDSLGYKFAVIYGGLPPGTKIMQSKRFNDPDDPCNVLVATDAVGMGLNLAIKRVVFYSLLKPSMTAEGTIETDYLTASQAQQIGGRAGRYNTQYEDGQVTTFLKNDLDRMHKIVNEPKEPLKYAGLNPTADQLEMFAYHLPKSSLSNLLDIFEHVCEVDDTLYFMCNFDHVKELADLIEHLPIPLRTRFTFCSAPMKIRRGLALAVFIKMARQFSKGQPLTFAWLCSRTGAPFSIPRSIAELEQLEAVFQIIDIYLWLGFRYPDMFLDIDEVRELRVKIDSVIHTYLLNTTTFVQNSPKARTRHVISDVVDDRVVKETDVDDVQELDFASFKPEEYIEGDKKETVYHSHLAGDKEKVLNLVNASLISTKEPKGKEEELDEGSVTSTDTVESNIGTESQMSKTVDDMGEVDSGLKSTEMSAEELNLHKQEESGQDRGETTVREEDLHKQEDSGRNSEEMSARELDLHKAEAEQSGTDQFTNLASNLKHRYKNLKFVKMFNKKEQNLDSETNKSMNAESKNAQSQKEENLELPRQDVADATGGEDIAKDLDDPLQHGRKLKSHKYRPSIQKQNTKLNINRKPQFRSNNNVNINSHSSLSNAFKEALTKIGKGTVISHDGHTKSTVQTSNKSEKVRQTSNNKEKARKSSLENSVLNKPSGLTERLLKEGLLSKDMLEKLKKEWELEDSGTDTDGANGDEDKRDSSTVDIGNKTDR